MASQAPIDGEKAPPAPVLVPYHGYQATYSVASPPPPVGRRLRRSARARFLHAFVFAGLALVLLHVVAKHARYLRNFVHDRLHGEPNSDMSTGSGDHRSCEAASWTFDPEGRVPVDQFLHVAEASFELPVSADLLFFKSKGAATFAHGVIEIDDSGTAESETGGQFLVGIRTSNSPTNIAVLDAPVDHTLHLKAHTSNSFVQAALHKTYEGAFRLTSSRFFRPTIHASDVQDPAEKGRRRVIETSRATGGYLEGAVHWRPTDRKTRYGSVDISTSNLGLDLSLPA
ncbi:predicted protein [Postia placenta Mad-698-R]|nr:predicted protein [Postia placenta Mad-698-R]